MQQKAENEKIARELRREQERNDKEEKERREKNKKKEQDLRDEEKRLEEKEKRMQHQAAQAEHLAKKQEKRQRQREQKRGADQTTACMSTGTSSGVHEKAGGSAIQRKMAAQLAGAHFRQINEELYTTESADAVELFRRDPKFFEIYHAGFRSQAAHWPVRPVDVLVRWLEKQPASLVVGDLGCGDAQIAASVRQTVHSFDLVANNPRVTACDVANVPLPSGALDVVPVGLQAQHKGCNQTKCKDPPIDKVRKDVPLMPQQSRAHDLPTQNCKEYNYLEMH